MFSMVEQALGKKIARHLNIIVGDRSSQAKLTSEAEDEPITVHLKLAVGIILMKEASQEIVTSPEILEQLYRYKKLHSQQD